VPAPSIDTPDGYVVRFSYPAVPGVLAMMLLMSVCNAVRDRSTAGWVSVLLVAVGAFWVWRRLSGPQAYVDATGLRMKARPWQRRTVAVPWDTVRRVWISPSGRLTMLRVQHNGAANALAVPIHPESADEVRDAVRTFSGSAHTVR